MARLASSRKLVVLVLSLVLLSPWPAQALPLDRAISEPLADAVSLFTNWLTSTLADVGCSWDPDGCYGTSVNPPEPPTNNVDVGCSWDPSGGACGNRG